MHKAFTLIELMIVVAIIAIVAAIVIPNLMEANKAHSSSTPNDQRAAPIHRASPIQVEKQ